MNGGFADNARQPPPALPPRRRPPNIPVIPAKAGIHTFTTTLPASPATPHPPALRQAQGERMLLPGKPTPTQPHSHPYPQPTTVIPAKAGIHTLLPIPTGTTTLPGIPPFPPLRASPPHRHSRESGNPHTAAANPHRHRPTTPFPPPPHFPAPPSFPRKRESTPHRPNCRLPPPSGG